MTSNFIAIGNEKVLLFINTVPGIKQFDDNVQVYFDFLIEKDSECEEEVNLMSELDQIFIDHNLHARLYNCAIEYGYDKDYQFNWKEARNNQLVFSNM